MNVYIFLKLLIGVLFLVIAVFYLYRIDLIFRFNKVLRETLFNDSYVALLRYKIGLLFLLMSIILLYASLSRILKLV